MLLLVTLCLILATHASPSPSDENYQTYLPCDSCSPDCTKGQTCAKACNVSDTCSCIDCYSNCPDGCSCYMAPVDSEDQNGPMMCTQECSPPPDNNSTEPPSEAPNPPSPTQPAPTPSVGEGQPVPTEDECNVTFISDDSLPLCGNTTWPCQLGVENFSAYCVADTLTNECNWAPCPSAPSTPSTPSTPLTPAPTGNSPSSPSTQPSTQPSGESNCTCRCRIETRGNDEYCGLTKRPVSPCADPNAFTSYQCHRSEDDGSCSWNIQCLAGGSNVCGNCSLDDVPTQCEEGQKLPTGEDLQANCVQNSSGCAWQTNCIVDQCYNQCDNSSRPTTCPSPYTLRDVDQDRGVDAECIMRNGQCNWVPMNCYPPECRVSLQNNSLHCGDIPLNCSLRCNVNPAEICVQQNDGTCAWNYQCPTAGTCEFYSDMTAFTELNSSFTPLCGTVSRPNCTAGQIFSGNVGCSQGTSGCEWQNNCEDELPQSIEPLCFFRKHEALGWMCGSELIPNLCTDGSRFVPSYCTNTSDGKCIARGYCSRTRVVQIDVNIIIINVNNTNVTNNNNTNVNVTVNPNVPSLNNITATENVTGTNVTTPTVSGTTPAPSSSNTQANFLCSGIDEPKCEGNLDPILRSTCVCKDDSNGNRKCSWSSYICQMENVCDQCNRNPCQETEQFDSGCCVQGNDVNASAGTNGANVQTNSTGQCRWSALRCIEKSTSCSCDNLPPTQCSYGQKRDNSAAPLCIGGSDGSCTLQSQCQNDTCGGIGTSLCDCDFANCVYVSFGMNNDLVNSNFSNNTIIVSKTGWEGCFSTSSDVLKVYGNFPDAVFTRQITADTCDQNNTQQSCDQNCRLVTMIRKTVSDNRKVEQANVRLTELQSDLRNSIDNETGCILGKDFQLTLLAIGVPPLNQDNSLTMNLVIFFQQLGSIQQPTQHHLRVYYQTVIEYISDMANFTQEETDSLQYSWNTLENYTQNNFSAYLQNQNQNQNQIQVQNGQAQQQTANNQNQVQMNQGSLLDGNNYVLTVTVPAQTLQRVFSQPRDSRDAGTGGSVSFGDDDDNSAQAMHTPFMLLMSFIMAFLLFIL